MSIITAGYSSYAANLEQRVITQNWMSYHRTKGRFVFRRIYEPGDDTTNYYHTSIIGYEMAQRDGSRGPRTNRNPDGWIIQVYHDGVALYKRNYLRSTLNNYPCFKEIDKVMRHYFYEDAEIEGGEEDTYYSKIVVMRRKPCSSVARSIALREQNLGDYLVSKYNMREGDNAAISR